MPVYLLPDGPKNLAAIFTGVNFDTVTDYYIQAMDGSTVVATSVVNHNCKCNNDESVSVHFLNYLGAIDSVIFPKPKILHDASGGEFINGLSYPLSKTDTGIERFNVRSNDTYEAKRICTEAEMVWLQEAMDSPKAFMEWNGEEEQPDDYLPIVILNGKFEKQKNEREYSYEFVLTFKYSNEFMIIRN
jgi:hypothetical protein